MLLQKLIHDYILSTNWWYTVRDIHNFLVQTTGKSISKPSILKYLKKWLNKSYKRCSSRPSNYDPIRTLMLKRIFAIELTNLIDTDTLLVNIDEVNFSKSTKTNYSWLNRGANEFRSNISFKGSMSLIWAITSQGSWFVTNLIGTNNTSNFVEYIDKLTKWIVEDQETLLSKVVIVLDNWTIHKSATSLDVLNKLGWRIVFLSPYSPEWAPIELLFNTLKRRLQIHCKNMIVNLSKEEGFRNVKECLATFSKQKIISYWRRSLKSISELFSIRLI